VKVALHTGGFKNTVLKALDQETIARLQLHRVAFPVNHEIEVPGNAIRHVLFVEEGMESMTTTFANGSQVEVGMFGYESVIGISALMGTKRSLNRVYTQIAGYGYSSSVDLARKEFALGGRFQMLALRYVQTQLVQAMQSAGCNATHEVEQRLARWLLLCADRAHEHTYKMSQEFLGHMLGTARPTVSVAAAVLKQEKLIEYTHGVIKIVDLKGLEKRSCECYRIIKDYLDNYAEFEGGTSVLSRAG